MKLSKFLIASTFAILATSCGASLPKTVTLVAANASPRVGDYVSFTVSSLEPRCITLWSDSQFDRVQIGAGQTLLPLASDVGARYEITPPLGRLEVTARDCSSGEVLSSVWLAII